VAEITLHVDHDDRETLDAMLRAVGAPFDVAQLLGRMVHKAAETIREDPRLVMAVQLLMPDLGEEPPHEPPNAEPPKAPWHG